MSAGNCILSAIAAVAAEPSCPCPTSRRPHAALEDANLNLSASTMRTEFHVGLRGKSGWPQISAPMLCHRLPVDGKFRVVHHDHKMRIAGRDLDALDRARRRLDCHVRGANSGNAHSGRHFHGESAPGLDRIHAADAQARIGRNLKLIARLEAAASAIHAATQRVPLPLISAIEPSALCRRMRPDLGPRPGEKLNAVRAHARVARAQPPRQFRPVACSAAASSVTIRKSLPQACAFVKGINHPPCRQ